MQGRADTYHSASHKSVCSGPEIQPTFCRQMPGRITQQDQTNGKIQPSVREHFQLMCMEQLNVIKGVNSVCQASDLLHYILGNYTEEANRNNRLQNKFHGERTGPDLSLKTSDLHLLKSVKATTLNPLHSTSHSRVKTGSWEHS